MFDKEIEKMLELCKRWFSSISEPKNFLDVAFHPSEQAIFAGIEFYIALLVISLLLSSPIFLSLRGPYSDKIRLMARGIIGLVSSAIITMTWHFSFWLFDGQATFAGTYLAYVYVWGPYLPLITAISLIIFSGLPASLRVYALNPAMKQEELAKAMNDPETSRGLVGFGTLMIFGITLWVFVLQFRCLSYVHNVFGWKLAGAILVSLILMGPVGMILKRLGTLSYSD